MYLVPRNCFGIATQMRGCFARLQRLFGVTMARWARRYGFVGETDSGRTGGMLIQYNFCRTYNTLG